MAITGWWVERPVTSSPSGRGLVLTGGMPLLTRGPGAAPAGAALTLTPAAPSVTTSMHRIAEPAPAVLLLLGAAPPSLMQPNDIVLALTGLAPVARVSDHKVATPLGAALTLTGGVAVAGKGYRPAGAALALTGQTPTVTVDLPNSFVNSNHANATTVSTATHAVGDLLTIVAWRPFTTLPGNPGAPWTPVATGFGAGAGSRLCCKIATATNDSSDTWTGADVMQNQNYRGATGIGETAFQAGSGTTIIYPALTLQNPGSSWVLRVCWQNSATNFSAATLTGYTKRRYDTATTGQVIVWDTNAPATVVAADNHSSDSTGSWRTWSIEILT